MAATQLDIYNHALVDAAMQPLDTITETSAARSFLDVKYATVAGAMLERFDWHFCRIDVALVATSNTGPFDDGWEFEYELPANSAAVRVVHPQYDARNDAEVDWAQLWNNDDSQQVIRTNLDDAYALYTDALDFTLAADVARLDNSFVQALSLNLASHLVTRFSQDPKKTVLAIDLTTRATEMARAHSLGRGIGAESRPTRSLRARGRIPLNRVTRFGYTP